MENEERTMKNEVWKIELAIAHSIEYGGRRREYDKWMLLRCNVCYIV